MKVFLKNLGILLLYLLQPVFFVVLMPLMFIVAFWPELPQKKGEVTPSETPR